jgi:hypothetical protein
MRPGAGMTFLGQIQSSDRLNNQANSKATNLSHIVSCHVLCDLGLQLSGFGCVDQMT